SRTERTILHDMGQDAAGASPLLDEALALAERLADDAASGRVDLADLGRRARRNVATVLTPASDRGAVIEISDVVRNKALVAGAGAWLAALPELVVELEREWDLVVGRSLDGAT